MLTKQVAVHQKKTDYFCERHAVNHANWDDLAQHKKHKANGEQVDHAEEAGFEAIEAAQKSKNK